jgi:hypothetical protein
MATWQYRCISCGSMHEAPLRPGGVVYLRCVVTRQWAWHDPSRFATEVAETTPVPRRRTVRVASGHARASTARRLSAVRTVRRKAAARRTPRGRRRR